MAKLFDKMFLNVLLLGFAFMFVFTAFQTCGMIQQVVIDSLVKQYPGYSGDGYISLGIIYAVFAVSNWFAPSVISWIGPKYAMLLGGLTYALFILNFLFVQTWALYVASVIIGIGASVIWTGQGNFLTINSDSETMSRNSGIFWALMQCSLLFGNILVYFQFQGKSHIDDHTRLTVFGILLSVCCLGLVLMLCLRNAKSAVLHVTVNESGKKGDLGPKQAFMRALQILKTKDMILLSVTFFYTGLELSFFSGVYGPSIGFTQKLGEDAAKYVGITGICIGLGEIIGGATFGIFSKKTNKYGRDPIILLGYLVHMITFYAIFINLPYKSPFGKTYDPSHMSMLIQRPSVTIAMLCAFGLGFGDACFNTQVYSLLGSVYSEDSAPAFALFKFFQSVAAAVAFYYSKSIILPFQLLILVVMGTLGSITFWNVEWKVYAAKVFNEKKTLSSDSMKSA